MGELWSIALTSEGVGVCALKLDASYRSHFVAFSTYREAGCPAVSLTDLLRALSDGLVFLNAGSTTPPLLLALSGASQASACFVDDKLCPIGPVFLGDLPPMSLRDIPDFFAQDPALARAYRDSPLRRLQQLQPGVGLNKSLGLSTLSSLVAYWLTGEHADACLPRGVPKAYPNFPNEASSQLIYKALGFLPELCARPVRFGHFIADIGVHSERLPAALHPIWPLLSKLKGLPLFHTGDTRSGFAYAAAADPLSWAVELGWQTHGSWTASHDALSGQEFSIVEGSTSCEDADDGVVQAGSELCEEFSTELHSRETLTSIWAEAWQKLDVLPGPRRELSSYGPKLIDYRGPITEAAIATPDASNTIDILGDSVVGSRGLHLYHNSFGLQVTGLAAYHCQHDLARALFEGQVYRLRHLREALEGPALGPLRICFSAPWDSSFASLAADILCASVYVLDTEAGALSALGSTLGLARDLDILYAGSRPSLKAAIIEPGERSRSYHAHYRNHCYLLGLVDCPPPNRPMALDIP